MAKKDDNCVFCKIVSGKIKKEFVEKSNSFLAFYDINPKSEGHTLIIPKQHWATLFDIPDKYGQELLEFTKKVASKLLQEKKGDGFNVIMNNLSCAGQVVMHAHIHVIPRKEKDGLKGMV